MAFIIFFIFFGKFLTPPPLKNANVLNGWSPSWLGLRLLLVKARICRHAMSFILPVLAYLDPGPLNIWIEHSNCQVHSMGDSKTLIETVHEWRHLLLDLPTTY